MADDHNNSRQSYLGIMSLADDIVDFENSQSYTNIWDS